MSQAPISCVEGCLTVRMYNVGFGDSFLIAFPAPDRPRTVLIDCGVHSAGPGPRRIAEVAELICAHIPKVNGVPRIDVVVATHRHKDHVSGFESPLWSGVEVGQVWMPWTEDPDDPEATRLREGQERTARRLSAYMEKKVDQTRKALALGDRGAKKRLEGQQARLDLSLNSLTNEKAMRTLHQGFLNKPERLFLPYPERKKNSFENPDLLPGVTCHVMGPSRDEEVIRKLEPPPDQSFLSVSSGSQEDPEAYSPFPSEEWALTEEEYRLEAGHIEIQGRDLKYIHRIGEDDDLYAAAKLDKVVNGTSLMILFEIGEARMLFPGDAQWGTWRQAMNDPEWRSLLKATNFLKVGHHGSHNATPVEFVHNILQDGFGAMVSTTETKRYPDIPRSPLLDDLRAKSKRVVRSDKAEDVDPDGFIREEDFYVECSITI